MNKIFSINYGFTCIHQFINNNKENYFFYGLFSQIQLRINTEKIEEAETKIIKEMDGQYCLSEKSKSLIKK